MKYKIGSFNVRNLSFAASKERLDYIADFIKDFDIIALQEVLSEGKMLEGPSLNDVSGQAKAYEYSLRSRLGNKWDMCWIDPKTDSKWYPYQGNDSRGEGYAFLWNKEKFVCPQNENGTEIRPRAIHQYKTDSTRQEMKLMRDPGYGRFKLVNLPNAEIRLLTTHIIFGKPKEDNLNKVVDIGAVKMRQNEFNVLARSIYTSVCDDHNDINCVTPYTIILGDYNLNLKESGAGSPYIQNVIIIDSKKNIIEGSSENTKDGTYILHTEQMDLSTVNDTADNLSNNYDHFTFDEKTGKVVSGIPRRINAIERVGDIKKYMELVSDHIPIMIELEL